MTVQELHERLDKSMKDIKPQFPEGWNDDIFFKQSQIVYKMMLQKQKKEVTFEDIDDAFKAGAQWQKEYSKLTWVDMKLIWNITDELPDMKEEDFYKEVLRRFLEEKTKI